MDHAGFQRGLELFNARKYFDAHEAWEDVWRAAPAEEKRFLQGLIQIAVALHHHGRGNMAGARSLLARAQRNLSDGPDFFAGLDMAAVRGEIAVCEKAFADGTPFHFQIRSR
jgi:uncharacterized protein